MANTLFPLTEHFVSSYENRLFFLIGTNCFSILEQSVHLCELTNYYNTIVDDMRVALGNMCLQMK